MKKGYKYTIYVFILLLALLVALPGMLNWNEYKQEVENTLYAQTGHRVDVEGNLVLSILPSPALSAEHITLLDPNSEPFLSLESLNVNVGFFALLTGKVEAKSIVLKGGELQLERHADGTANWDFLVPETSGTDGGNVKLDHVSVQNLNIIYKDAILNRHDEFTKIDARLKAQSNNGPFEVETSFLYEGVDYAITLASGRIEEARSFPLSANIRVAGQSPGVGFQGTVVIEGAASAASGQFSAEGGNLGEVISGLVTLAEGQVFDSSNLPIDFDKNFEISSPLVLTKARIAAQPLMLTVGETTAEGKIIINPIEGGVAQGEMAIKLNNIKLDNWLLNEITQTPASDGNGEASEPLPIKMDFKLEAGLVEYNNEQARRTAISGVYNEGAVRINNAISLLPGNTELKLAGTLNVTGAPSFSGNVNINSNNLRYAMNWLGFDIEEIPQDRLKGFSLLSVLRFNDGLVSVVDASGQIDGTQYSGDMSYNKSANPQYKADLVLSNFDVDKYFPSPDTNNSSEQSWAEVSDNIAEGLAPLKDINAELKLKADKFTIRRASFNNLALDAKISGNRLLLTNASTSDFKGISGNISGAIDGLGGPPRYNFELDIKSPSLTALTRWAGLELPVDTYKLAAVSIKGHVDGTLAQVNMNVSGRAAQADYMLNGYLGGLNPRPEQMNLRFSVTGENHMDFIRRMDVPLELDGEGMVFVVAGKLDGQLNALSSEATIDLVGGKATIMGDVDMLSQTPKFNFDIDVNHASLKKFSDAFGLGLTPDSVSIGRFKFVGNVAGANNIYDIKSSEGMFGFTQYEFDLRYNKSASQPSIDGSISLGSLPLSNLYGSSETGAVAVKEVGGQRWSRKPFAYERLREIDMNISFAGQDITYEAYKYSNPKFTVKLEKGVLNIDNFSGQMFGGRTIGSLQLDARTEPVGSLVFSMEEADLAQALLASAAIRPATGRLSLRTDIKFAGKNQFEAISSLNGTVELWAQNGVIKGIDIDRISNRLARLNRLPDFLSLISRGLAGGETPYGNIRTNFAGQNGVFSARSINADIEGADVEGRMEVNLPTWRMSGTGKMTFNQVELPAQTTQTAETDPNAPPPEPVREVPPIGVDMAGDIDNPTIDYRTDRLRNFMAERFASSLLENIIGGEGGLGGLGGLFGLPTGSQPTQESEQQPN